jgi:hypothetical protein
MRSTFFIKAGATAVYDVPYDPDHRTLDPVWTAAREGLAEIGLHPSYFAHDHPGRLERERARLATAAEQKGTPVGPFVRTHFLRWIEPSTPRALAGAGFSADTSLGFSGRVGYRRGTALPFRLFDVLAGRPLDLWEVPLCAMDTALFVHGGHGQADALAAVEATLAGAAGAGGLAVLLWHNEPLPGGHLEVLYEAMRRARAKGARIDGLTGALDRWRVS